MRLSPIALFVYNRPWHTEQTLIALSNNDLASKSVLYIFADGPKENLSHAESIKIHRVRKLIRKERWCKEVIIIEADKNKGLANSIIDGVTEIVNRYGKIIVLEDDIVTSPSFLAYMNLSLDKYQNEKKVWNINSFNYPIKYKNYKYDTYFTRLMICWGWGTWSNRWKYFEKDPKVLIDSFSPKEINKFNIDGGENYWIQVSDNYNNKLDTWAVFWYAAIFRRNGLCLNPINTYVSNIGFDGTGVNCKDAGLAPHYPLNNKSDLFYCKRIHEDKECLVLLKSYLFRRYNLKRENKIVLLLKKTIKQASRLFLKS